MGTDDLHRKRKQQAIKSLQRKIGKRKPYDRVLIVCEGSKSERYYLQGLCKELQLSRENINIPHYKGSDPIGIVSFALKTFEKAKDYDRIFCVFDKDLHQSYNSALNKIKNNAEKTKNPVLIKAITSVPCFEYWLLLHFADSAQPYMKKTKNLQVTS